MINDRYVSPVEILIELTFLNEDEMNAYEMKHPKERDVISIDGWSIYRADNGLEMTMLLKEALEKNLLGFDRELFTPSAQPDSTLHTLTHSFEVSHQNHHSATVEVSE